MQNSTVLAEIEHLDDSGCIVCNQRNWAYLREARDLRRPECDKKFRLTRCLSCGHVMQNPLPDAIELGKAYDVQYAPYRPAWKESGWPIWRVLRTITTRRRVRRLRRCAKGSRLLEVGCGGGDFLFAASHSGWEVAAVEYNNELADLLRSELGYDVRPGGLIRGTWNPESFDLVVLWSVLEHVPDPVETLATISSYLKPGGTVFIQIPTKYGLQIGRCFGEYWENLDLPRHLNFFGKESLSGLCRGAGLTLTIFKTPLLDTGWGYVMSCSNFSRDSRSKLQRFMRLALLAPTVPLMLPFLAVQAWRGRGTEAFAVAHKK